MTIRTRKTLSWALTAAAFVVAVAAAGCSGSGRATTWRSDSAAPVAVAGAPSANSIASLESASTVETHPPQVNVFGEFDGAGPRPVKSGGEAGFQQHTFVDEGFDSDVTTSPDGKWIVFASTRHSVHPDIYLQHVDGQSVTQLTSDEADDAFPAFSPDGRQVAFSSTRNGSWDILVMDIDGKNVTQVTSGPQQDLHPSFSPDGKRLVYSSIGSRSGQWELWTVNLETGEKRMIGFGLFPNWSPDRSVDRIAFQRARQRGSRWFSLWTLDLVDNEARRLTEVAVSNNAAIVAPSWSPDGRHIAFGTIVNPAKTVAGRPEGQQDIWTINADGSNKHRLTDGNGTNLSPCWASSGQIYFISDRSGTECIWSAHAESGTAMVKDTGKENPQPKAEGAIGATDQHELPR